jgi:hypothetical protein
MNEIPERMICQATQNGKPISGIMIQIGIGVVAKNSYRFSFGPTNHDGCTIITRDEILKRSAEQLNLAMMDYSPLPGAFSGDIMLRVKDNDQIKVKVLI